MSIAIVRRSRRNVAKGEPPIVEGVSAGHPNDNSQKPRLSVAGLKRPKPPLAMTGVSKKYAVGKESEKPTNEEMSVDSSKSKKPTNEEMSVTQTKTEKAIFVSDDASLPAIRSNGLQEREACAEIALNSPKRSALSKSVGAKRPRFVLNYLRADGTPWGAPCRLSTGKLARKLKQDQLARVHTVLWEEEMKPLL